MKCALFFLFIAFIVREAQPKQLVECVTHICDRSGREFDEPRRARVNRQMNDVRQQWLDKFRKRARETTAGRIDRVYQINGIWQRATCDGYNKIVKR